MSNSLPTYAYIINVDSDYKPPLVLDGAKAPAVNGLLVNAPFKFTELDLRGYEVPLIVRAEFFAGKKIRISHFAVDAWHQCANNFYVGELEISVPLDLYDDWKKQPDNYKHPDGLQFIPLDENGKPDETGTIKHGRVGKITIVAIENRETKERGCQGIGSFNGTLEDVQLGEDGIHIETDVDEHGISIVHGKNVVIGSDHAECKIFSPSGRYKPGIVISDRKQDRVSSDVQLLNVQAEFFDIQDHEACTTDGCGLVTPLVTPSKTPSAEGTPKHTGDEMIPRLINKKATPMEVADLYLGQKEYKGAAGDNPFIVACFQVTSYKATDDETAWCSAAHCYMHEQAGKPHTKSAAALSWKDWGVPVKKPKRGDTIVADYGNGRGHVGFYMGETHDAYVIKGGNQSDAYRVSHYPKDKAYRWYFRRQKTNLTSKTNWTAGTVGSGGAATVGGAVIKMQEEVSPVPDKAKPSVTYNEESPVQCSTAHCPPSIPDGMTLVPTQLYQGAMIVGFALIAAAGFIIFERARRIAQSGI